MSDSVSRATAGVQEGHVLAGRYVLRDVVASGGMAQVWEADDTVLDRRVAVKILHPHLADDAGFVERFRGEARAAARLSHQSIVAIFDTASEDGIEAIVMELIDGITLRQYLDSHGSLRLMDAADLTMQVADALEAAHSARIVHRDIKPGNIILCPDRRTKVTDFGIAKALEGTDHTADGTILGTAKYLAPEQVEGTPVDQRADVYSLGVVLFEALVGRPPFDEETDSATALARLRHDPPSPRAFDPTIPPAVERVVLTALSRHRDRRYPTAAAMRDAVSAAVDQPDVMDDLPIAAPGDDAPTDEDPTMVSGPVPTVAPPATTPSVVEAEKPQPRRRVGGSLLVAMVIVGSLALGLGLILATGAGRGFFGDLRDRITGDDDPEATEDEAPSDPQSPIPEPQAEVEVGEGEPEPTPEPLLPAGQPGGPTIDTIADFDPLGDGEERPDLIAFAVDGDPATSWLSEGYNNRSFGNLKDGVGVVIVLDGERTLNALSVVTATTGWAATVFAADAPADSIEDWGGVLDARVAIDGDGSFDLRGVRATAVLLWITDLGDGTEGDDKARMEIAELTLS